MGFWSDIWDSVVRYAKRLWNAIKKLWKAIVRLAEEVVDYFRSLWLDPNRHKPFIGDFSEMKKAVQNAPTRNVGIFRGVYNEQTDTIESLEIVEANSLDQETKKVLGSDPLVVLT